jgi:hypothetical protein
LVFSKLFFLDEKLILIGEHYFLFLPGKKINWSRRVYLENDVRILVTSFHSFKKRSQLLVHWELGQWIIGASKCNFQIIATDWLFLHFFYPSFSLVENNHILGDVISTHLTSNSVFPWKFCSQLVWTNLCPQFHMLKSS